jgi:hypothetical protein
LAYKIIFARGVDAHLDALTARQEATVMAAIKEQLPQEPRPVVVITAVGIKIRERVRIAGKDFE